MTGPDSHVTNPFNSETQLTAFLRESNLYYTRFFDSTKHGKANRLDY